MNQKRIKTIRKLCRTMGIPITKDLIEKMNVFTVNDIRRDIPLAEAWREAYDNRTT